MSTPSNRQRIIEALRDRVCAIRKSSGFQTDAGATVFLGEAPSLGPDDPDVAIAIVIGEDGGQAYQGEQVLLNLPVEFQALAKACLEHPWRSFEAVLADIKTAVELADRRLGLGRVICHEIERGTTRTLDREEGTDVVGVAITYTVPYTEVWGTP